jgi:hypothetical protein
MTATTPVTTTHRDSRGGHGRTGPSLGGHGHQRPGPRGHLADTVCSPAFITAVIITAVIITAAIMTAATVTAAMTRAMTRALRVATRSACRTGGRAPASAVGPGHRGPLVAAARLLTGWSSTVRSAAVPRFGLLVFGLGAGVGVSAPGSAGTEARVRLVAGVSEPAVSKLAPMAPGDPGGNGTQTIFGVLDRLVSWGQGLLVAAATCAFVIAGIRYLFAFGDMSEIETAKRTLKAAVIGFAIAALAGALASILSSIVGR